MFVNREQMGKYISPLHVGSYGHPNSPPATPSRDTSQSCRPAINFWSDQTREIHVHRTFKCERNKLIYTKLVCVLFFKALIKFSFLLFSEVGLDFIELKKRAFVPKVTIYE